MTLERHVQAVVRRAGLGPADAVVVGFSGGPDSLALLGALQALHAAGRGPRPLALHVNHRLRPEADEEATRAAALAAHLGVTVTVTAVDVAAWDRVLRQGIEAAARAARYAALAAEARAHGTSWVAVAHTANDQAETVLLRLARGSGLEGLAGMREQSEREVPLEPAGTASVRLRLLRPLLGVQRSEVEAYLGQRGLEPITDPSNVSPEYRRNVVRHAVLPALERAVPGATRAVARSAALLRDDADYLEARVADAATRLIGRAGPLVTVARAALRWEPPALQRRLLIQAARRAGVDPVGPSAARVEALRSAAVTGPAGKVIELGSGIGAWVDYDTVALGPLARLEEDLRRVAGRPLLSPGSVVDLGAGGEVDVPLVGGWRLRGTVDPGAGGWRLRTRRPGDRYAPSGGRRRSLQDWLVDRKVPSYLRDWLPLLERDGVIVWVAGVASLTFQGAGVTLRCEREAGDGGGVGTGLSEVALHQGLERILIDEATLQARVRELGREIAAFYGDRTPLLIGVLTGAFVFMADLTRAMAIPVRVEFMAVSSYGQATETSGVVRILKDLDRPIEGEHVLLVEDIIDSGLTLSYLLDVLQRRNPASLRLVALLRKEKPRSVPARADWVGFDIPDEFVVGYGLDVAARYRNLPFVAVVKPEAVRG